MIADPPRTVLLLGASNVSLGLRTILRTLRGGLPGDLHVLVAAGHGRSYAKPSSAVGRTLPGLLRCGAWAAFADRPPGSRPLALLTDVGNDLLYGTAPATLTGWVAACLDRLGGAEVVLTLPPVGRAAGLPAWQYHAARTLFFPTREAVPWAEMKNRAAELHGRLSELAAGRGVPAVDPPAEWYGVDPIHVRRGRRREAWEAIFARWPSFEPGGDGRLPRLPPVWGRAAECRAFGKPRVTPQPVWSGGGVSLSLY